MVELTWDGKYDSNGKRVAPLRLELPFQTVETVDASMQQRQIALELTDFVIPPDDVPEDVQRAISHWSQWIDYWAVDWDNKGDTFHNQWQTYRTRQDKKLTLKTSKRYDQPGEYMVMVKVIDILGNDTTKTIRIDVV